MSAPSLASRTKYRWKTTNSTATGIVASSAELERILGALGSIWTHDTAIVLAGLARGGYRTAALGLADGLLAAAEAFDHRLPELYGGDDRELLGRPVPYPAACRPQAWSAASAVLLLQAGVGLYPDVPAGRVRLAPLAGPGLGALAARNLRVAGARVDVTVTAAGEATVDRLPSALTATPVPAPAPPPRRASGGRRGDQLGDHLVVLPLAGRREAQAGIEGGRGRVVGVVRQAHGGAAGLGAQPRRQGRHRGRPGPPALLGGVDDHPADPAGAVVVDAHMTCPTTVSSA